MNTFKVQECNAIVEKEMDGIRHLVTFSGFTISECGMELRGCLTLRCVLGDLKQPILLTSYEALNFPEGEEAYVRDSAAKARAALAALYCAAKSPDGLLAAMRSYAEGERVAAHRREVTDANL